MSNKNRASTDLFNNAQPLKSMLTGAAIALIPTLFFLLNAGTPDPSWPNYWMIRPAILIPFAGAIGGFFYFLAADFRAMGGWKKMLTIFLCIVIYLFGLWIGVVLGFDGTLWD